MLLFVWRLIHDVVFVVHTLRRHHVLIVGSYAICNSSEETFFFRVTFAKAVWFGIPLSLASEKTRFYNLNCCLMFWVHKWRRNKEQYNEVWIYVIVTVHHIWRVQNDVVWRGVSPDSQSLVFMIKTQVASFLRPILTKDIEGSN